MIVAVGGVFAAAGLGVIAAAVIASGTAHPTDWCAGWFWGLTSPMAALVALGGYMLTAPWHGARFNVKTGAVTNPPAPAGRHCEC